MAAFKKFYTTEFSTAPQAISGEGYDAVRWLVKAVADAGTVDDATKIRAAMPAALSESKNMSNMANLDEAGDVDFSGTVPIRNGSITYEGKRVDGLHPSAIVKRRLVQCAEGHQLYREPQAWQLHPRSRRRGVAGGAGPGLRAVPGVARPPAAACRDHERGQQQMLAIGRALMAGPALLMMDEPSRGLAPLLVSQLFDLIAWVIAMGTTILLVEQNAVASLRIAHRAYVLESGRIALTGAARDLMNDPRVREVYLGL